MTLLLGFAAVNTGNNLLYLLVSALLGFMAVSGIAGRLNLAGLRLRLEVPEEIYDGVETLLSLRLENRKRLWPSFLLELRLAGGAARFAEVAAGDAAAAGLAATFSGRGRHALGRGEIHSPFPVNFFVRSLPIPVEREIVVFPAPRPGRLPAGAGGRHRGGESPARRRGSDGEIARIADYRGGEPLKLIHWRLSARHDALKVKELSDADRQPLLIDLGLLSGDLEERLGVAAHLVRSAGRRNRPVGLRGAGPAIAPATGRAHMLRLLTALALHGRD